MSDTPWYAVRPDPNKGNGDLKCVKVAYFERCLYHQYACRMFQLFTFVKRILLLMRLSRLAVLYGLFVSYCYNQEPLYLWVLRMGPVRSINSS